MLEKAYALWHELEQESGQKLLHYTGGLDIGRKDDKGITGVLLACKEHNLEHEVLEPDQVTAKFPGVTIPPGYVAIYQKDAGILEPEKCTLAHYWLARVHGAVTKMNVDVTDIALIEGEVVTGADGRMTLVRLITNDRDKATVKKQNLKRLFCITVVANNAGSSVAPAAFFAVNAVLTAGAWSKELVAKAEIFKRPLAPLPPALLQTVNSLSVERQVVNWFRPLKNPEHYALGRFPIFLVHLHHPAHLNSPSSPQHPLGDLRFYYGFPCFGADGGFKCARYDHFYEKIQPDNLELEHKRGVSTEDILATKPLIETCFPGIQDAKSQEGEIPSNYIRSGVCMFTNTPDGHFVIDAFSAVPHRKPTSNKAAKKGSAPEATTAEPRVVFISACSGHGFKFASVIGQIAADLSCGKPREDVDWLSSNRFVPKLAARNSML